MASKISSYLTYLRKGNHCADKLANFSLPINSFRWSNTTNVIMEDLVKNKLDLHFIDFVSLEG